MHSENTSKKIVRSSIDLANMAKWLMDKNEKSSVTQELERLFPWIRDRGRRDESSELHRVGAGESSASATDTNNNNFATQSTTKRTIEEIWGSNATLKKPLKSMLHKTTSGKTRSKFVILSRVKRIDFRFVTWFMSFLQFDLPPP